MIKQNLWIGMMIVLLVGVSYIAVVTRTPTMKVSHYPLRPFADGFNCAFFQHARENLLLNDTAYQGNVVETLENLYDHHLDRLLDEKVNVVLYPESRKGTHYYEWLIFEPYFGWIGFRGWGNENKLDEIQAYIAADEINGNKLNPHPSFFPYSHLLKCLGEPDAIPKEEYMMGAYWVVFFNNRDLKVELKTNETIEFLESNTLVSLFGITVKDYQE